MSFKGTTVTRLNGGLGRRTPTNDGVGLLIAYGGVATSELAINTVAKLLTLENAEDLGITASYDDTNDVLVHHHIDEFFRISPDGTLYIVLADATFDAAKIKTLIRDNSEIKFFGVVRNSATAVVLATEIAKYQTIVTDLAADNIRIDAALIEGNEFNDATLISAYANLRATNNDRVSVVIAQDPIIRGLKTQYENYAAIGSVLGGLSVRRVNESLGSVDIDRKPEAYKGQPDYPLTNANRKRWLDAVLQSGVSVDGLSNAEKQALTDKGYIYVGSYTGYAGFFFNASPTCSFISSDYAFIQNNRVWNKAARAIHTALMPRIKGNLLKEPETGFIREIEATELEAIALRALNPMVSEEEVSAAEVYINPNQQLDETTPLVVRVKLTINDIIYSIDVQLGLTK